jgi:formate hydrogenlyase transcriptional activator
VLPISSPYSSVALQRYATLLDVADVVCSRQEPHELFPALLPRLRSAISCDLLNYSLHHRSRKNIHMYLWNGSEPWPANAEEVAVEGSAAGWVWRNQQALSLDDVQQEPRFKQDLHSLRQRKMRSYCVVPLTTPQQRLGALGIASAQSQAFGPLEEQFLRRLAKIVALAIDNTQAQSTLIEERERIKLLFQVSSSQVRAAKDEPPDHYERISLFLQPLDEWRSHNHAGLYLYDSQSKGLRLYSREPVLTPPNSLPRLVVGVSTPLQESIAGRVFLSREAGVLNYADLCRLPSPSWRRRLGSGVKSLCMVPVFQAQDPVAVLKVSSLSDHAFSQRDVELLTQVAELVVFALESHREFPASLEIAPSQTSPPVSNNRRQPGDEDRSMTESGPTTAGDPEPAKLISFISEAAGNIHGELLTDYFSSSTLGLCILDTEFRYLAINRVLAEKNGMLAQDCLGKNVAEVLGDLAAKIKPQLEQVLATGGPVLDFETANKPDAKDPTRWLKHSFPIKDPDGRIKQIGVVVADITEQRKLDESVRQLTDKLQQEQNRLQMLREMDLALAGTLDLKQLFAAAASCLEKAIPFDLAGVWLYDQQGQTMRAAALSSKVGEVFQEGEISPIRDCMLAQSMLAGEAETFNLARASSPLLPSAKRLLQHGLKTVCAVPLVTPRGPLGAIGLGSRNNRAFHRADVVLLNHAASSIALALEIALTREALQQEKNRLHVLSEISSALGRSKTDLRQTFPAISTSIHEIVRHDMATIGVYSRTSDTVRAYTLENSGARGVFSEDLILPLHQSIVGQLLDQQEVRNFSHEELEVYAPRLERLRRALDEGMQSLCYVPLLTPRGILGAILLGRKDTAPFSEQDADFLKRLASELALSVESAAAQEALAREKDRLQALREIDATLVASTDLEQALPHVSQCLRKALPHNHMGIYRYDERARVLRGSIQHADENEKALPVGSLSLDNSIAGQVFVQRKARILDYTRLAEMPAALAARAIEHGVRSICFIPLITAKGPMGVLLLASDQDNAFWQTDIEFLEQVAAALAQAVQNASGYKALLEEKKRLQVLLSVSAVLTTNWNVQETFATISSYLRRVFWHECAFFTLYEQNNKVFVRQAQDFPLGKGLLAASSPVFQGGPQSMAIAEQRPVIFSKDDIEAFRSEAPMAEWANGFLAEGLKSLCCVPLLRPKGPLGTLSLASTKPDAFGSADADMLNQVAAQLAIALENAAISREIDELNNRMEEEKRYLQGKPAADLKFEGIIGDSPALRRVLEQVATVAGSDATALILGETGTGKELIARAVHRMSRRRERSFIKLNCAAIPTGLLESELFGHEKGAFTGAVHQKIGRLELAHEGTLFLDEVGEIPLEMQPKLLRVLQDHEFERLGGVRTIEVNLRLVAATNRQLSESVSSGDFRSDLFYRLNVFPIRMPPLRERRHDISALVRHFVKKYAAHMDHPIESVPTETINALMEYHWPGNVRELENLIERSIILSEGATLRVPVAELTAEFPAQRASDTLEDAEREHIVRVLRETRGVISGPGGAAHKLGLKRTTLQSKMQRLGITRKDY